MLTGGILFELIFKEEVEMVEGIVVLFVVSIFIGLLVASDIGN